ncbi:MAG TPA: MBOAT family protein [Acidimicrobiales bacterium]|jgi:D-alanyl-lipoteichoic acid acyltransferase DltB (MBOAT superfamily)|nr:MBOAT family protein [Acidimicrobiales bacterium]
MLFPTLSFAVFFVIVLPVSWLLLERRTWWRLFMVAASWFFYGCAGWGFVPLLIGSTVVNHAFAFAIDRNDGRQRVWLVRAAVVVNLAVLGWFKYIGFLSSSTSSLLDDLGLGLHVPVPKALLPAGISFFTFQALSYVIDVYRRKLRPVTLLDFAVYLSFFPHLLSGPIVRASEFLPQIRRRIDPRRVDAGRGLWLIGRGLFKKVVISSYMASQAADPLFNFPHQHGGIEALFGIYAYAIQIYADFSGYTDIAIGLALLLGVRFPQNFDVPYTARSLHEFWRRWHMTLSRWLRDYLYIPLGGNRRGSRRTYVNLMATMVLGGLWHGAAWTFVAWGALHGAGLVGGRLRVAHRSRRMLGRDGEDLAQPELVAGGVTAALWRAPRHVWPRAPRCVPAAGLDGGGGEPVLRQPVLRWAVAQRVRDWSDHFEDRWSRRVAIPRRLRPAMAWLFTFNFVCLGWVFFRATSFANALTVLGRLFTWGPTPLDPVVALVVVAALAVQFVPARCSATLVAHFSRWRLPAQVAALALTLVVIDVWGPAGVTPFIYFRF